MKKIFTLLFVSLLSLQTYAQEILTITHQTVVNGVWTDGHVTCNTSLIGSEWFWMTSNDVVMQTGLNSLNANFGDYKFKYLDLNGQYQTIHYFVGINVLPPCSDLNPIYLDKTNASSLTSCDGTMSINLPGTNYTTFEIIRNDGFVQSASNLCTGYHMIAIKDDLLQCNNYTTQYIGIGQTLIATVVPTAVSAEGVCDGSANVNVINGVPPYSFAYSNGSTTTAANNLCQGVQSLVVTDAANQVLNINFVISSPNNVITNPIYLDSTIVDSLYNPAIINCVVDYANIDSAYILSYSFPTDNTVFVFWNVVSGGITTTFSDVYVIDPITGIYMVSLGIYCPTKSIGEYFVANDYLFYDASSASIADIEVENNFSVFPNPVTDYFDISLKNDTQVEIILTDLTGKEVIRKFNSSNLERVDVGNLPEGQYILTIKNESFIENRKIVK